MSEYPDLYLRDINNLLYIFSEIDVGSVGVKYVHESKLYAKELHLMSVLSHCDDLRIQLSSANERIKELEETNCLLVGHLATQSSHCNDLQQKLKIAVDALQSIAQLRDADIAETALDKIGEL